jgi:hypothetical protein
MRSPISNLRMYLKVLENKNKPNPKIVMEISNKYQGGNY